MAASPGGDSTAYSFSDTHPWVGAPFILPSRLDMGGGGSDHGAPIIQMGLGAFPDGPRIGRVLGVDAKRAKVRVMWVGDTEIVDGRTVMAATNGEEEYIPLNVAESCILLGLAARYEQLHRRDDEVEPTQPHDLSIPHSLDFETINAMVNYGILTCEPVPVAGDRAQLSATLRDRLMKSLKQTNRIVNTLDGRPDIADALESLTVAITCSPPADDALPMAHRGGALLLVSEAADVADSNSPLVFQFAQIAHQAIDHAPTTNGPERDYGVPKPLPSDTAWWVAPITRLGPESWRRQGFSCRTFLPPEDYVDFSSSCAKSESNLRSPACCTVAHCAHIRVLFSQNSLGADQMVPVGSGAAARGRRPLGAGGSARGIPQGIPIPRWFRGGGGIRRRRRRRRRRPDGNLSRWGSQCDIPPAPHPNKAGRAQYLSTSSLTGPRLRLH